MSIKIAISGAHSQGKTTLVNALKESDIFKGWDFMTSMTRSLEAAGFVINEGATDLTQLNIMLKHYERALTDNNTVLDRCALDGLVYSSYLFEKNQISCEAYNITRSMFTNTIHKYKQIFYIKPELPLINDGQRSVNAEFYDGVKQWFDRIISKHLVPITVISGSVEERVATITEFAKASILPFL